MSRIKSPALVLLALSIVLPIAAIMSIRPPAPVAADAPADVFSAERAFRHVEVIARAPHPTGTAANDAVRAYLVAELEALGLSPQIQEAVGVSPRGAAAWVDNVIARVPGTRPGGAALLMAAHYDSVPQASGASDDGAGVAALLETARALRAGPPLANDVIFLISDGEEIGLLGARAFATQHPWMADVGAVLNFEARGHGGPVYMFETSAQNGWLIEALAEAAPYPVASSLMFEVYRRMPNDTDFTVFKEAGVPGLNFAFISGPTHYHASVDTPAHLDRGSLQHHGSYALALARRLGDQDLRRPAEPNRVYFDLFGRILLHHAQAWVWPLAIVAGLGFAGVALLGWRRGRLAWSGLAAGALMIPLAGVVVYGAVRLAWGGILALHPDYRFQSFVYGAAWYWLAFVAISIGLVAALHAYGIAPVLGRWRKLAPERQTGSVAMGALLWWLALLVIASHLVPGASYLFLWPLLAALAAVGLSFVWEPRSRWTRALLLALAGAPALVLLMPQIHALHVALTIDMLVVSMLVLVLLLGALVPQLAFLIHGTDGTDGIRGLPALGLVAGVALLLATSVSAGYDAEEPRPSTLFYLLDASAGEAHWIGREDPDAWTGQVLEPGQPRSFARALPMVRGSLPASPAPLLDAPAPILDVSAAPRGIRLHVRSPRQAQVVYLYVRPEAAVQALELAGQRVSGRAMLEVWNPPAEGFEVLLEVPATTPPLEVVVIDQSLGLPSTGTLAVAPRPPESMPSRLDWNDSLLVSKTFPIPPRP